MEISLKTDYWNIIFPSLSSSLSPSKSPSISSSISVSVSPSPSPVFDEATTLYKVIEEDEGLSIRLGRGIIPVWNTAGRPTGIKGLIGGNSQTGFIEWYDGTKWIKSDGTDV